MRRLRDLTSRSKRPNAFPSPFAFAFPAAVSRRSPSEAATDDSLAQAPSSHPHPSPFHEPSACQVDAGTQTDSKFEAFSQKNGNMADKDARNAHAVNATGTGTGTSTKDVKLEDVKAKKKGPATKRREAQQHLLAAMADILTAHGDVLARSGQNLSRTLNDLARDILEMNGILSRGGDEIGQLDNQLRNMQRRFDEAYAQLQSAKHLAGRIIDDGAVQIHRRQTLNSMEQALQGISRVMGDEHPSKWDKEKVNGVLAVRSH